MIGGALALISVVAASCGGDRTVAAQDRAVPGDAAVPTVATETDQQICEAGCKAASSCLLGRSTCVADCLADPRVEHCAIVARAGDCPATAACGMRLLCADVLPRGQGTCRDAATCQRDCGGQIPCACRCSAAMDPRHTLVLAQLATCVLDCDTELCVKASCGLKIATCLGR